MLKKTIDIFLFIALCISAETLILQNGLNGYDGTEDISIINNSKAERYSFKWDNDGVSTFNERTLVVTEFCC